MYFVKDEKLTIKIKYIYVNKLHGITAHWGSESFDWPLVSLAIVHKQRWTIIQPFLVTHWSIGGVILVPKGHHTFLLRSGSGFDDRIPDWLFFCIFFPLKYFFWILDKTWPRNIWLKQWPKLSIPSKYNDDIRPW